MVAVVLCAFTGSVATAALSGIAPPVAGATGVAATPLVPPDSWAKEGARLAKVGNELPPASAASQAGHAATDDYPPFAYQSAPIDVDHDETATLYFGPVPTTFSWPQSPDITAFAFPKNVSFRIAGKGQAMTERDGKRYLAVTVAVTALTRPYHRFTVWVY